jgi:hypothetical protein
MGGARRRAQFIDACHTNGLLPQLVRDSLARTATLLPSPRLTRSHNSTIAPDLFVMSISSLTDYSLRSAELTHACRKHTGLRAFADGQVVVKGMYIFTP